MDAPCKQKAPVSHTCIDLILSFPSSNTIFKPSNTFIDTHNNISDHRPVSTSIAIPTNPINIYNIPHNSVHYRPLNKEEKSHFTSLSKPLNDWLSKYHDTLIQQPIEQFIPLTDFLLAALDAYPNATVAYTNKSDDPTVDTPSGAAITLNTTPPTTICNISPIKGSYPAKNYAIILFIYLRHINTFSQPIIRAIDNLSECSTLHQKQ